jgi:hypothetical protein
MNAASPTQQTIDYIDNIGAGERIQTVDPNLGKVMVSSKIEAERGVLQEIACERVSNGA